MNIFVQNVRSQEFYAGDNRWSTDPKSAQPFRDVSDAVQFCQTASRDSPETQLIIHFRTPTTKALVLEKEAEKAHSPES